MTNENKSEFKILNEVNFLFKEISYPKKLYLYFIVLIMIVSAIAEILSIGAIIPFISILFDINNYPQISFLENNNLLNTNSINFKYYVSFAFCLIVILSGLVRVFLIYIITNFSYTLGNEISTKLLSNIINQKYEYHIINNTSETISNVAQKVNIIISQIFLPLLTLLSTSIIFIFIFSFMLLIDYRITILAFSSFFIIYLIIIFLTKNFLKNSSKIISLNFDNQIRVLQESMLGIKDIILTDNQRKIMKNFNEIDFNLRKYQGINQFITSSPRFVVEAIAIVLIVFLALMFSDKGNKIGTILPTLAALAFCAQKLLPLVQQSYWSFTNIIGTQESLFEITKLFKLKNYDNEEIQNDKVEFNKIIKFEHFSYYYNNNYKKLILKNINLEIKKGDKIFLKGKTGQGKTTFINILMGLLSSSQGNIYIDEKKLKFSNIKSWQSKISHVPQNVFLLNSTIKDNIIFGSKNNLDEKKLNKSIKLSCLDEYITNLKNGIHTLVGENGIQISGGQKQRIGIARALYRDSDILIFDEATNALDETTEKEVIRNILTEFKNKTLIIISHRLITESLMERSFQVENNNIIEI